MSSKLRLLALTPSPYLLIGHPPQERHHNLLKRLPTLEAGQLGCPINPEIRAPEGNCLSACSTRPGRWRRLNTRWSGEATISCLRGIPRTREGLGPSLPESFFPVFGLPEDSGGTRRGLGEDSGTTRTSVRTREKTRGETRDGTRGRARTSICGLK